ncbi:hypothetical protein [Nitratireductor soli]|uniref:hypothetical protein n=1 Tax=Nitratireductor soli TaxID=1670619 RepID=UPI00065DC25F|nr:hypothetical protein [Nitratireductor soli]
MNKFLLVAGISLAAMTTSAFAASGDMQFNGDILDGCSITIDAAGTLAANAALSELSSTEAGGSSGRATILATAGGLSVSTAAPAAFSAAPGGAAATFASFYTADGVTTAGRSPGATLTALNAGTTTLEVDLVATSTGGAFPAGAYAADVTVTCE